MKEQYILGIVVTTSPTCSLYRMVVFPAPSKPSIKILISLVPNRPEKRLEKKPPGEETHSIYGTLMNSVLSKLTDFFYLFFFFYS